MSQERKWSDAQILSVFKALGLKDSYDKDQIGPKPQMPAMQHPQRIFLPRLSVNSVPPPTGTIEDAKLERDSD